jgi:hypothetical protein
MQTFGPGLKFLRIPGINQNFLPDQVELYPPCPEHRDYTPMDNLVRTGYYRVSRGAYGTHYVPIELVYFIG